MLLIDFMVDPLSKIVLDAVGPRAHLVIAVPPQLKHLSELLRVHVIYGVDIVLQGLQQV